jgi:hypothetical protein
MRPKGLPHVAEVQDRSTFALNKNLLGATITDAAYRFKFDPPRTWARFSASEVEASISAVRPPAQSGFTAVLLYGFRDASSGAVMLVAAIKPPPNIRDSSFAEQMDAYGPIVEAQFRPTPVRVSGFIKGALRIVQFQAQSKPQVVYRLVFNNKRKELIVVEFTVPRTSFDNDIQELESVIASLDVVK